MHKEDLVVNRGIPIDAGCLGLAETRLSGLKRNGPDWADCQPTIEPCGEDVYELCFHVPGHQSIIVLGNVEDFGKLGRALLCLVDSRDLGSQERSQS